MCSYWIILYTDLVCRILISKQLTQLPLFIVLTSSELVCTSLIQEVCHSIRCCNLTELDANPTHLSHFLYTSLYTYRQQTAFTLLTPRAWACSSEECRRERRLCAVPCRPSAQSGAPHPGKGHQPARDADFCNPDADPAEGSGAIPDSVECSGGATSNARVHHACKEARAAVRSAGAAYMLNYIWMMLSCLPAA
jgi:hypothetical protein